MAKVIAGITISLDGYITGPNDRVGAGLGDGGERLHYWVFGGPWTYNGERGLPAPADVDNAYLQEVFGSGGAMICGRTMHDVADGWGDDPGFGVPVFVVTHRPHDPVVKGNTSFEFVTGGIVDALSRAQEAAGGKDVIVMGGGDLLRQYLAAGLVDAFTLTIAPVLLRAGKRLFDRMPRTEITFERTRERIRAARGLAANGISARSESLAGLTTIWTASEDEPPPMVPQTRARDTPGSPLCVGLGWPAWLATRRMR